MANTTQTKMFGSDKDAASTQPVECLGMTFPNEEARRKHFLEKLREKLKDPAFRKIEGFPIGDDEDILALSDPPYYTACPNPFLSAVVAHYGVRFRKDSDDYHREPFTSDVSEGRSGDIYDAHSYHTKVPHKAIMRYLAHFSRPGDLVLDIFCGSGQTGVACEALGKPTPDETEALGDADVRLGVRHPILIDLSPAATLIAHNYTSPLDCALFGSLADDVINSVQTTLRGVYSTTPRKGMEEDISYCIWAECFVCKACGNAVDYWTAFYDPSTSRLTDTAYCANCHVEITKSGMVRYMEQYYDPVLHQTRKRSKRVPVVLQMPSGRFEIGGIALEEYRRRTALIESQPLQNHVPVALMPEGERKTKDAFYLSGTEYVHDFYSPRNLRVLAALHSFVGATVKDIRLRNALRFLIQSYDMTHSTWMTRVIFKQGKKPVLTSGQSGTLYVVSLPVEKNIFDGLARKQKAIAKAFRLVRGRSFVSTQSATDLQPIPDNSIDYAFIDPPFGKNLHYAELNFLWETWLGIKSQHPLDIVIDDTLGKTLLFYHRGIRRAFTSLFRVLKPNRWVSVVFHNSSNAVWQSIQDGLFAAGFVVADVRTLDKQQETIKQSQQGVVKQDLVISAYKPPAGVEERVRSDGATERSVWEFISSHLGQLPIFVERKGNGTVISERQSYLLFDRMVAFFVQREVSVPMSAGEFFAGLSQKYPERDGMYFLPSQVPDYEQHRERVQAVEQLELFVSDEKSAIQWVRRQLGSTPMTYQTLSPLYMKEAQRVWEKHEQPLELSTILEENFIKDSDDAWRIPDLKREADLEHVRTRALLKEFQLYLDGKGKLKVVRTEALRAGFKQSWQKKDYTTIVQMAKRLPENVIQEDPALLMYFDNASLLAGE